MAGGRGTPPGRAGLLWLRSRLRAARLAADLLERRLRLLRAEGDRLAQTERAASERWRRAWMVADTWAARTALLGGGRDLRLSTPTGVAEVAIAWTSLMGTRYPDSVDCRFPEPSAGERGPGGAACLAAAVAVREAVIAAAAHGAAMAARRTVETEMAATRRRLRAIADRRLPALEEALRTRVRELDEDERAETVRLRWALRHGRHLVDDQHRP